MTKTLMAGVVAVALAALAATTAMAHDDEEVEGNRIVVGFLHEPAYEGERNAVSIRVTKGAAGGGEGSSGMAGMDMSGGHQGETSERLRGV